MNFFKSVFLDEVDPQNSESEAGSPKANKDQEKPDPDFSPAEQSPDGDGWSFGGLVKTLATRSESVLETYRRDLQEFGSELKKEMEVVQGSLGTVGHAVDEFGNSVLKGTAQIIAQGKDALLAADHESDSSDTNSSTNFGALSSKRYSRIDGQVRVVQGDVRTYSEEPEDSDDFNKWKSSFDLDQKGSELEELFAENADMKGIYQRIVPSSVDHETFWFRYFYKVHRLKQAEAMRANLVKRAISLEDEEELSWDIDEDEDDDEVVHARDEVSEMKLKENEKVGSRDTELMVNADVKGADIGAGEAPAESKELSEKDSGATSKEKKSLEKLADENDKTLDANVEIGKEIAVASDGPGSGEKSSDSKSDFSTSSEAKASGVLESSSKLSMQEEEDLGWDEIEDLSSVDEKEATRSNGSMNRADLHKRLSTAEEEEDLNWDIEDDDEPGKA